MGAEMAIWFAAMPKDYIPGGGRCCGNCLGAFREYGDDRTENHYCNIGFIGKHLPMSRKRRVGRFDICARWERNPAY